MQVSALGDEDLRGCAALAELRLSHNDLTTLPAALSSCSKLKIVDLGSTRIADVESVQVRTLQKRSCAMCDYAGVHACRTLPCRMAGRCCRR